MKKVKINGRSFPIAPTMWAQVQFKRDKGKAVAKLKDEDIEEILYYAYLCVKGACMRDKVEFDMTFDEFLIKVEGDPLDALLVAKEYEVKKKESLLNRTMRWLSRLAR